MKKFVKKSRKSQGKINWEYCFNTITNHAVGIGFDVEVHNGSSSSELDWYREPLNKPFRISIQKRDWERMCYDMLHELGHHGLRLSWKEYQKRYPAASYAEKQHLLHGVTKYNRRTSTMIDELREEFDAWDEALKIATELKIPVKQESFNKLKVRSLTSYVRYYGSKLNRSRSAD
jgi:hypothetical protein